MTWVWPVLGGLALLALATLALLARVRRRTSAELAESRAEAAELRARLDRLEQAREQAPQRSPQRVGQEPGPTSPATTDGAAPPYTITHVGEPAPALERTVFADLVLRESVIRIGSLAHGVRHALSAETRHRIRFEMRRELKRTRKQRRVEQREAYREWQARRRSELEDDSLRETA